MLEKRTKMFVLVFLLFALLATCTLNTSGRMRINSSKTPHGQTPIRKLDIILGQYQHGEFFEQLRKFADKHGFKILITQTDPSGENFLVEMWRADVEIDGLDSGDPGLFLLDFYNANEERPASLEDVDELIADLKAFISEIPNIQITEKRKDLTIILDKSQREELFTQLQKVANMHSLGYTLSFSSDNTVFRAEISGDGFHVTIEPVVGIPEEIAIAFFLDYYKIPTSTSQEAADKLFNELKSLLNEIPNVTILEE